jgi:hypothetical protein
MSLNKVLWYRLLQRTAPSRFKRGVDWNWGVRDSTVSGVVRDRNRWRSHPRKQTKSKTELMKKVNQILFVAVIATTLSLASQANAQYRINEDDGIAASPKARQTLTERRGSTTTSLTASKNPATTNPNASAGYPVAENADIAASPRARQLLNEQARRSSPILSSVAVASAGHESTRADGIAASPKLSQQLNERPKTIIVAPVK